MISIDVLLRESNGRESNGRDSNGLDRSVLDQWIENDWVRADVSLGVPQFEEIDVARVRLIRDLREVFGVNDDSLPVVLLLLDQVYDLRRLLRAFGSAPGARGDDPSPPDSRPSHLSGRS